MFKQVEFEIQGVAPLLLHNGQMADPLNEWAKRLKEVSSKKKKTDADHERMGWIEFMASLYVNEQGRVIIPDENITTMIRDAAKKVRLGKDFESSVYCDEPAALQYGGPKDPDKLWEDKRFVDRRVVRIQKNRVSRTRPIFRDWKSRIVLQYNDEVVKRENVTAAMNRAGVLIGLGDYRPRFGRFIVLSVDGRAQ